MSDQRDEKIALLSQQVLGLRKDLTTERRRTRREKPDEERWWDALLAAGAGGATAKQAANFAKQAMEEYHRRNGATPEATAPLPSDPEGGPPGGDADGPASGDPAR